MKICLITPPSPFLLDERVFMHIGILKIAAVLEREGHKVDFIDLSAVKNYMDVLEDYVNSQSEKITIGITATTPQVPYAVKIGEFLKNKDKVEKTILGGPHVTLMSAAAKREKKKNFEGSDRAKRDLDKLYSIFDVLSLGDGEYAVFEALKRNPQSFLRMMI